VNVVTAERRPVDVKELIRTGAPERAATIEEPTIVRDAETGALVCVVARFPGDLARYRWGVLNLPLDTTVRAGGIRNRSRVFGYSSRRELMRRNACRCSAAALEAPEAHSIVADSATELSAEVRRLAPERAEPDETLAKSMIDGDWLMGESWWTSGVLNFNSPLAYHFDANNAPVWNAMVSIRKGVRGGHLHVPAYDLVLACRDGDVAFFPAYQELHGVTPLKVRADGYRFTAVYYTIEGMKNCLPVADEVAHGARGRTQAEDTMLARQAESGLVVAEGE
jgi:hypothetical protein